MCTTRQTAFPLKLVNIEATEPGPTSGNEWDMWTKLAYVDETANSNSLGATKYSVTSITVNAADVTVRRFTTVTPCFRAGRGEVIRFRWPNIEWPPFVTISCTGMDEWDSF